MKKLLSLTLLIVMLLSMLIISTSVSAKNITSGDYIYALKKDNTAVIIRYIGNDTEINVPSEIDGHKVTVLDECSLHYTKLVSVKIPNTVQRLRDWVFSKKTEKVILGKNVNKITGLTFSSALNLKTIIVNKKNKNFTSKSGVLYNKDMTRLIAYPQNKKGKSFKILNGVKTISSESFAYNKNLRNVTFSKTVKNINDSAFAKCKKLEKIKIPKNIVKIDMYAFCYCKKVKDIVIKENKKLKIDQCAFQGCINIKSLTVPNTAGTFCFAYCKNLEKIVIPSNVKIIKECQFVECRKLKNVTIPKTVKKIEDKAFGFYNDNSDYTKQVKGFTIKGKKGSAAQKYAKANGFKFIAI